MTQDNQDTVKAYHFLAEDGMLRYSDGREAKVGETLEVEVEPVLCEAGLHASRRLLDAAQYAPINARLCLVEVSGDVVEGDDKLAGKRRKVTAMLTSEETSRMMREVACRCADMALDKASEEAKNEADRKTVRVGRETVEVTRRYLRGEATTAELEAARYAAWAAGNAAWAAENAAVAARNAAWAAGYAAGAAQDAAEAARNAAVAARNAAGAGVPRDLLDGVMDGLVEEAFKRGE